MENSDAIASALADEYARKIISILISKELCAQEIAAKMNIPTSTTYRKLKTLEDLKLIKKTKVIRTLEGLSESYYRSLVREINVKFKDGEISYSVDRITMDDKIIRLWQKFKE